MATLQDAIELATAAHKGQSDKAGQPYINHPLRVMEAVQGEDARIVAVLHDVVEDTDMTLDSLRSLGYSTEIVSAVDALTRREGEDYAHFVRRAGAHSLALPVKIADLRDNLQTTRISNPTVEDQARMDKYRKALVELTGSAD